MVLHQLFGSRIRAELLSIFFAAPAKRFYVREIIATGGLDAANASRELKRLVDIGILTVQRESGRPFYALNHDSVMFPGLYSLFLETNHSQARSIMDLPPNPQDLLSGKKWYHQPFDRPVILSMIIVAEVTSPTCANASLRPSLLVEYEIPPTYSFFAIYFFT
jgi:DNA-binding transcriptional ArsR family regulator